MACIINVDLLSVFYSPVCTTSRRLFSLSDLKVALKLQDIDKIYCPGLVPGFTMEVPDKDAK